MAFEGFVLRIFEGKVTKFAPHEALKLTLGGKLTSDDGLELHREAGSHLMVKLHRVAGSPIRGPERGQLPEFG